MEKVSIADFQKYVDDQPQNITDHIKKCSILAIATKKPYIVEKLELGVDVKEANNDDDKHDHKHDQYTSEIDSKCIILGVYRRGNYKLISTKAKNIADEIQKLGMKWKIEHNGKTEYIDYETKKLEWFNLMVC